MRSHTTGDARRGRPLRFQLVNLARVGIIAHTLERCVAQLPCIAPNRNRDVETINLIRQSANA
ncbi:hypothetical protein SAMN04488115_104159 [Bosea lathyri]|uniref:Uncharacterized protein n=1 Tax=Bosea lathyri TaxID=1036778 RepID=A0A1H5YXR2_9HYPH|nr:hypothetical protein SAMN04488115_104159 [Bosea lathyri]